MKRLICFIGSALIIVGLALGLYMYTNKYDVEIHNKDIKSKIYLKGFRGARAISKDDENKLYVAYEDEIVKITDNNNIEKILSNSDFDIDDIEIIGDVLIVLSKDKIYKHDLGSNEEKILLEKIPYKGENLDRRLLNKNGELFLTIGASTNSGIAKSNGIFEEDIKDVSPFDLELRGVNYGEGNTGGFKTYGDKSNEGDKIKGEKLGNASIVSIDIENGKTNLYASGVRNVEGIDYDSKGNIFAIVGGIEEEGDRGVKRDSDYIYNLNKGGWYGWPDFSGGDPISSPRFTDTIPIEPIIKNPPNDWVVPPIYQHYSVDSLECLVVDREGVVQDKDSIIFYDEKKGEILSLDTKSKLTKLIGLKEDSEIEDIIILEDKCLLLEGEKGIIYSVINEEGKLFSKEIPLGIFSIIIVILIAALIIVVNKLLKRR